MENLNRRGFIKSAAVGTAGAFLGSTAIGSTTQKSKEEPSTIRRRLGKTDIELPIVSFGVMRSDNAALIKSAYEMGYVHFDTAHNYMEGRNEIMLGEVFKSLSRDSIIVSTKV